MPNYIKTISLPKKDNTINITFNVNNDISAAVEVLRQHLDILRINRPDLTNEELANRVTPSIYAILETEVENAFRRSLNTHVELTPAPFAIDFQQVWLSPNGWYHPVDDEDNIDYDIIITLRPDTIIHPVPESFYYVPVDTIQEHPGIV